MTRARASARRTPRSCTSSSTPAPRSFCLVGKAWDLHVTEALRTTSKKGWRWRGTSVAFLRGRGRWCFFDAQHFFDGCVERSAVRRWPRSPPPRRPAPSGSCSATPTGSAAVRHRPGRARRAGPMRARRSASSRAQRRRLRRRELARCRYAGVLQVQAPSTATASAPERRYRADRRRPGAQDGGRRRASGGRGRTPHRAAAHYVAEVANLAPAAAGTRSVSAFTHKAGRNTNGAARCRRRRAGQRVRRASGMPWRGPTTAARFPRSG